MRDLEPSDQVWAQRLIGLHSSGGRLVVNNGEQGDPLSRPGIVVEHEGRPIAFATVDETALGMQLLALHSELPGIGAGTRLLETALRVATASDSGRIWLLVPSANLAGIRFCLRRGMRVAAVHGPAGAERIELELPTEAGDALKFRALPLLDDLNALPPGPAADALAPLFEGAPRFLARLAGARPYESEEAMLAVAREIARSMPEQEQLELINAHPRIGADPATVSPLSHGEQGYHADADVAGDSPAARELARIHEELAMLNEIYERRFGFRYVIFVAGRPKSEIVPLLERAISADRESELRRALDDTIHIGADRLAKLRTEEIGL